MTIVVCWTYDERTPESAAHGDSSDGGFYSPGGWTWSLNNPAVREEMEKDEAAYLEEYPDPGSFIHAIESEGLRWSDNNQCFEGEPFDLFDGEGTQREIKCFLRSGVTVSSARRINKVIR